MSFQKLGLSLFDASFKIPVPQQSDRASPQNVVYHFAQIMDKKFLP
jgi:hypothetical protein